MSILVIGEKPSVSRELAKVLGAKLKKNGYMEGNGYIVSWCFGHLVGLKFPDEYSENWAAKWSFAQLPMIPNEWKFKISEASKDQFKALKELMTNSDVTEIICATDADREGECIFRYVYNLVKCKKPVKRLWISSLEESAIRNGFNKLKNSTEYDNLYQAGFCRAKADWLVGMNGSRLFSVRYNAHLNTGRVQTPTLAMIVKRDDEIANFVKQKYFTVDLDIGFKASSARIDDEREADNLVSSCNNKTVTVTEINKEVKSVSAPKLFDLTSLQREANKKFGYTAQQTLDYMQSLYEKKLVTYPRTDSQYLSDDMEQIAYSLIPSISEHFEFGRVENPNLKAVINNSKVTGHHAIIPTEIGVKCDISLLSTGEQNILKLVALRLLCASASAYKYGSVKVKLLCENTEFTATGRTVLESGWKALDSKIGEAEKSKEKSLPNLENSMTFTAKASKSEHFTIPPKAYTEDTLLSAMEHAGAEDFDENAEKTGLGTPATRANTIENLVKHGYIERDGKKIISTGKGRNLIKVMPDEVKSAQLTADWENKLLEVERGNLSADSFMNEINNFVTGLVSKYGSVDNSVSFGENQASIGNCPKCNKPIIKGKYGWYCSARCGMNLTKVFGVELSEGQVKSLLSGKETSYIKNGRKTIVVPKIAENTFNGKTYFNWATRKE
ncbi:DNA topoisomerase 3 [Porcipelethomonas sp.]|uniref:DNA topoisomerase 3 n=1 Tax=Porcipelethomonas sp. TaxID=2981675 RepID=UPI003EF7F117